MTVHQVLNEERKSINVLTSDRLSAATAAEVVADEQDVRELLRSLDNAVRF